MSQLHYVIRGTGGGGQSGMQEEFLGQFLAQVWQCAS